MRMAISMIRSCGLWAMAFISSLQLSAQAGTNLKTKKGILYFAIGTQRIFYTPGDIHVRGQTSHTFDFILHKVKGQDEGGFKWDTAPQFSYTVGYYFKHKKFGIEYQYDHIKYFATPNQVVRLKGTIDGHYYDQDTTLVKDFFQLEHSDGANYAMLNVVRWFPIHAFKSTGLGLDILTKAGAGIVHPKTNSNIMNHHRDDRYHISGFVTGVEAGLRFHFLKYIFVTGTFKGTYANYSDFLIAGGRGRQKWLAGQFNYLVGGQFAL